ncbi:hypothetical protein OROGR_026230 [Orobanche gracilis]
MIKRMGHKLVNLLFILTIFFFTVAHSSRLNPSTIKTSLKDAEVEGFGDDEEANCKVEECLGKRTTMAAAVHLDYIYT